MRKAAKSVAQCLAEGMARAIEVGNCLEWQGKMGNGKTVPVVQSREGKTYAAEHSVPRLLWERAKGPIPSGQIVYRTCCNNACVSLRHLAAGTRAEWMENRREQGLTEHSVSHVLSIARAARRRAQTINSIEKAREVRALLPDHSREEVARLTGVSLAMVRDIGERRAWKDYSNPFVGLGA